MALIKKVYPPGKVCSQCYRLEAEQNRIRELFELTGITGAARRKFDIHKYKPENETQREALNFLNTLIADGKLPEKNVILRGDTGVGKTHLSIGYAAEMVKKGFSCLYSTSVELLCQALAEKKHGMTSGSLVFRALSSSLLILDDIGVENTIGFTGAERVQLLYFVVDSRWYAGKPIITTTNESLNDLQPKLSDRIVSRLQDGRVFTIEGRDHRR
ncbi:MAG: ATP-binding protein [candidate division Zixibacteria bacterium]|nr:ATP-binding protein [candidate division Zixibacteria bacterium]